MVQEYIGKGGGKKKKNISSKIKIFKKKKKQMKILELSNTVHENRNSMNGFTYDQKEQKRVE